ncbi:glycosyl transferase [Aureococcus anophagefferens]|nr:glycosyl transferase [Aureococcus anophagefferens]
MVKGGEGIGDDAAAGATGFVENGPATPLPRNRTVPGAGDAAGFRGACAAPAHAGPAGPGEPPSDAAFRRQSAWPADAGADAAFLLHGLPPTSTACSGPSASPGLARAPADLRPRRRAAQRRAAPAHALSGREAIGAYAAGSAGDAALRARLRQRDAGLLVAAREAARAARARAVRWRRWAATRSGGGHAAAASRSSPSAAPQLARGVSLAPRLTTLSRAHRPGWC